MLCFRENSLSEGSELTFEGLVWTDRNLIISPLQHAILEGCSELHLEQVLTMKFTDDGRQLLASDSISRKRYSLGARASGESSLPEWNEWTLEGVVLG